MAVMSIEQRFIEWLEKLGFDAFAQVPNPRPSEFVTVERTGGGVENYVDMPLMAIQAWAATQARAEEMALEIRAHALMGARPYGVSFIEVDSGPYKFYDEESMKPRYQLVLDCAAQLLE